MPSVGLIPAVALVAGTFAGAAFPVPFDPSWLLLPLLAVAILAWWRGWPRATLMVLAAAFLSGGAALASDARAVALGTPLRAALHEQFGGFDISSPGPAGRHDPIATRALLLEDAAHSDGVTSARAAVEQIHLSGGWRDVRGGVTLSISGREAPGQVGEWRAGRRIEAPVAFRRPARYLNDGVPDFEANVALRGTTLFGSVKSGLLVGIRSPGSPIEEAAASVRAFVRGAIERWVASHSPVSAAIVVAVLIGDRTSLPDDVRLRLQAAGTYHVIAISGGNIAILAGLTLLILACGGVGGRRAATVTLVVLVGYAGLVTGGASVWRATLMASLYLVARIADHRSTPWHAIGIAAVLVLCAQPLEVRNVGFVLTFAASAALLECARRVAALTSLPVAARWLAGAVAVSAAAEIALLPVNAWTFSRITGAGLALNLVAVPLMGVVQVAGLAVVCLSWFESIAGLAGWVAHAAAATIAGSARLIEVLPWLTARVPPPPVVVICAYYAGLGVALTRRGRLRAAGYAVLVASAMAIVTGVPSPLRTVAPPHLRPSAPSPLRTTAPSRRALSLTVFDVGQADATLLQLPDGGTTLVDAGGSPFGSGAFDIGARVLAPALWARGVRRLDRLVLTHGDPDHVGGARSVAADFVPGEILEGVRMPGHAVFEALRARLSVVERHAGYEWSEGGVRLRVLHPPPPDWQRVEVRNDDSVVLEIVYGDVAILLPGDIGAAIERQIAPRLTPARIRILKAAHHGSRTSSSRELLEHWRPTIALISAGRGNTFGHPHPDVIRRLEAIGAAIYRTDRDGQITLDTDGRNLTIRSYMGGNDVYRSR